MEPDAHGSIPHGGERKAFGLDDVMIGMFGAADGTWLVSWQHGSGDVRAEMSSAPGEPVSDSFDGRVRVLGRFLKPDYVLRIVAEIDQACGSAKWRLENGVETLTRWLARVAAGLDGEVGRPAESYDDQALPRYLDFGHTITEVDLLRDDLLAPELWSSLGELQQQAGEALEDLADALAATGNVARAAAAAQELVEMALSLHLALADGYRAVHERFPGDRRRRTTA